MKITESYKKIKIGTTDYRMAAKKMGFDWSIQVIPDEYMVFSKLREVSENHLGNNWINFPLGSWRKRLGFIPQHYAFGSHYAKMRRRRYQDPHKLYFRTQEDVETILTLFVLQTGIEI